MVLHPVGGNFEHLVRIIPIGIISHSIAILSVPFTAYGFWGLTKRLDAGFFSNIAFTIMIFGMVAVMLAASINGLILMDFVDSYRDASQETIDGLRPFFVVLHGFNHAFDFIFIGAVLLSTLFWSIAILVSKRLPVLLAYLGFALVLIALLMLLLDYVFVDLHGFRIFIFGWVIWVVYAGLAIRKANL